MSITLYERRAEGGGGGGVNYVREWKGEEFVHYLRRKGEGGVHNLRRAHGAQAVHCSLPVLGFFREVDVKQFLGI